MLQNLIDNNRQWSEQRRRHDASFFQRLSKQQKPKYLWIGCSDSRVPANEVVGLQPGELFVHRNIANIVVHSDLNALSVLQYAVEVLKVEHVIVCGHYQCGGAQAAMQNSQFGLMDNWLRNIKDVYHRYEETLESITDEQLKLNRFCEFNVMQQVENICHTSIVQNAWQQNHPLSVHGVIYNLEEGLLADLGVSIANSGQVKNIYRIAC